VVKEDKKVKRPLDTWQWNGHQWIEVIRLASVKYGFKIRLGFWARYRKIFLVKAGYLLAKLTKQLQVAGVVEVVGWEFDAERSWRTGFDKKVPKGKGIEHETEKMREMLEDDIGKGFYVDNTHDPTINSGMPYFDYDGTEIRLGGSFMSYFKEAKKLYPDIQLSATILPFKTRSARGEFALLRQEEVKEVVVQAYTIWHKTDAKKRKEASIPRFGPGNYQKLAIQRGVP
jgi:hypothetical protein